MDEVKNNNIDAIPEQNLASVSAGENDTHGKGAGFPCPQCNCFIKVTMMDILMNSSSFCPSCGVRIDINKMASARALDALKEIPQQ